VYNHLPRGLGYSRRRRPRGGLARDDGHQRDSPVTPVGHTDGGLGWQKETSVLLEGLLSTYRRSS
jgi:hypothetical protein